jgi:hypothetical protein
MLRFYGHKGSYAALISTAFILYGGVLIYYQLMSQTLFPFIVGIQDIITGNYTPSVDTEADFTYFSLSWTSIIIFVPLYLVICLQDRKIFIRLSSYGVLFILIQILFVIIIFFISVTNTSYSFSIGEEDSVGDTRNISMFKSTFQPLAGMLAAGYYLHQLGLQIIHDNKKQENNSRDVFLGYFCVFLTYCCIGICGYFGFNGSMFEGMEIKQNILNMFATSDIAATIVRI